MAELVIHIGTHKTASTSLQDTLFANREILQTAGLHYPAVGPNCGHHALLALWHPNLPPHMTVADPEREWSEQTAAWREQEGTVLVSSEEFSRIDSAGLQRLKSLVAGFDRVRIVMVLRDQAGFLQSVYQQISDDRHPGHLPTWLNQGLQHRRVDGLSLDYYELYQRFATLFGADNMLVLSYRQAREHDSGLVDYVLQRVHGGGKLPVLQSHRANVSPKPLVTFVANAMSGPKVAPRSLVRQLDEFVTHQADGRRTVLFTAAEVQRIAEATQDSNAALETELGLAVGSLHLDSPIPGEDTLHRGALPAGFWSALARFFYQRNGIAEDLT